MKTGREYIESLRALKPRVYSFGERVESVVDHPLFQPHLIAAAVTYELAHNPETADLMTARSHLSGKTISRFTHIHQTSDDLVKKVRMMRLLGQRTATCFQRCVGLDALNALYSTTFDIDRKRGTDYHQRFRNLLAYIQENDLMLSGAMSDVKGDRSLAPSQQADPDMYVHVTERRKDGIVVRGAKAHITGAINCHEMAVMPTRSLGEQDRDYAVAFVIPPDAPGVTLVFGRQTNDTRRLDSPADSGNPKYGIVGGEALVIFDDVFVPWERVFMCGEVESTGQLVETFAGHHRSNYGGCKVGLADVVIGASAWLAEANGVENAPNIGDLLAEMVDLSETCWACSLACAFEGKATLSGAYSVDPLLANVVKLNATRFVYEWMRLAQDIAGGLVITLPSQQDLASPEVGPYLEKYLVGKQGFSARDRVRMLRLVENMAVGAGLPEALHGAGSPAAQKIMIRRRANLDAKKQMAKLIAGLADDPCFRSITGLSEDEYFRTNVQ